MRTNRSTAFKLSKDVRDSQDSGCCDTNRARFFNENETDIPLLKKHAAEECMREEKEVKRVKTAANQNEHVVDGGSVSSRLKIEKVFKLHECLWHEPPGDDYMTNRGYECFDAAQKEFKLLGGKFAKEDELAGLVDRIVVTGRLHELGVFRELLCPLMGGYRPG